MRYTQVLKKVNKSKRLLRVFISNVHSGQAAGADGEASEEASWTLKIEGKLQEDAGGARNDNRGGRRKFTSYVAPSLPFHMCANAFVRVCYMLPFTPQPPSPSMCDSSETGYVRPQYMAPTQVQNVVF